MHWSKALLNYLPWFSTHEASERDRRQSLPYSYSYAFFLPDSNEWRLSIEIEKILTLSNQLREAGLFGLGRVK